MIVTAVVTLVIATVGLGAIETAPALLEGRKKRSSAAARHAVSSGPPAFAPLDLGESPMRWPSQSPWPKTRLPPQPWPSELWPVDYFQRKGGSAMAPTASESRSAVVVAASETQRQDAARLEGAFFAEAAEAPPARPKPAPRPAQPQPKKQKSSRQPAATAEPPPARAAKGQPSDEELIAIVRNQGLATAVDELRARTGWDFQRAATHLAAVMRKNREQV